MLFKEAVGGGSRGGRVGKSRAMGEVSEGEVGEGEEGEGEEGEGEVGEGQEELGKGG